MAETTYSDLVNPEILTEAVQAEFAKKGAFVEASGAAKAGIARIEGGMPESGPTAIGKEITIPYFGTLGEFAANAEGSSVTPGEILQTSETATVARYSLAFEVSRWARGQVGVNPNVGDVYQEGARQILQAAGRAIDDQLITSAAASGALTKSVYSATTPAYIDYDGVVDAKTLWGDEQGDIAALICHSQTKADMLKLKDATGQPLLVPRQNDGQLDRFVGIPILTSDKAPLTGSSMGTVSSTGTAPPTMTITGTPLGPWDLIVDAITGTATTIVFRFSVDGGNTYSVSTLTAEDDGVAVALTDTATDSLVGVNGATGLSVAFAAGTFNADNNYTAKALMKATTLICKSNSLAFWYNRNAMAMKYDTDILKDSDIMAMHLYGAPHRYRRVSGGTRTGVVALTHNVRGFVG